MSILWHSMSVSCLVIAIIVAFVVVIHVQCLVSVYLPLVKIKYSVCVCVCVCVCKKKWWTYHLGKLWVRILPDYRNSSIDDKELINSFIAVINWLPDKLSSINIPVVESPSHPPKYSCGWTYGYPATFYISQSPFQLVVIMWLSSHQWSVSACIVFHSLIWALKHRDCALFCDFFSFCYAGKQRQCPKGWWRARRKKSQSYCEKFWETMVKRSQKLN